MDDNRRTSNQDNVMTDYLAEDSDTNVGIQRHLGRGYMEYVIKVGGTRISFSGLMMDAVNAAWVMVMNEDADATVYDLDGQVIAEITKYELGSDVHRDTFVGMKHEAISKARSLVESGADHVTVYDRAGQKVGEAFAVEEPIDNYGNTRRVVYAGEV